MLLVMWTPAEICSVNNRCFFFFSNMENGHIYFLNDIKVVINSHLKGTAHLLSALMRCTGTC